MQISTDLWKPSPSPSEYINDTNPTPKAQEAS